MPIKVCLTFGCENLAEGRTDWCGSCNRTHRKVAQNRVKEQQKKELRLSAPKPSRSKVKPISDKQKERLDEYKVLRWEYLLAHPDCQVKLQVCTGKATTIHHTEKRGRNLCKVKSFLSACMACHDFLETRMSIDELKHKGLRK